jgi:hypothetical protein
MSSSTKILASLLCLICAQEASSFAPISTTGSISERTHVAERWASASTALNNASFGAAINDFYINTPIQAAFITCAVKASAADAFAQFSAKTDKEETTEENNKLPSSQRKANKTPTEAIKLFSFDSIVPSGFHVPRNLGFLIYGGFYQGIVQYFFYNVCFPEWFGTTTDPYTVAMKVLTDAVLLAPHLNLPCSYSIKAAMHGSNYPIQDGVQNYLNDIVQKHLLFKFWALWIPVNILTFSVVPEHLRIPFVASVSFFWLIILSSVSCNDEADVPKVEQNA